MGILERVNYPSDLKKLGLEELHLLAGEIREQIIATVSRSGGHLASSLGTVELTLAIHYVFDTPQDKVIWDVGHQAYAHKIITGRKGLFHTLRQRGGISGFPKREESEYDVFDVGHCGTSISAATGLAEARCLEGKKYRVLAVIGDASITCGMAFEAFNWAGDRKKDLIIILNDNEMSISPNVGALSAYLSRIMTGETVTKLRREVKGFLNTIPLIGENLLKFARHVEESLKAFIVPGAIFEELGFTYVGPLEGHRLDSLIWTMRNVKKMSGPILIHVITKKGKGYRFAEEDPLRFHGVSPFCIDTGKPLNDNAHPPTYTNIFGKTLVRLARENPKIVAITAAMCEGTGLAAFAREMPQRFYDVGIAEQHAVTFAAGLALEGFIPVVAVYSSFIQRAYDQILHDVCLQNLPIVLALDRGGFVGEDGPTHHGLFDYSFLRAIPGIMIMAPKDENELQHMLKTAVSCNQPVCIRYPRGIGTGRELDDIPTALEIGKAEVLMHGDHLAIIAIGSCVYPALSAARLLQQDGIGVTMINARFVKPLDEELLCATAVRVKIIITVEENVLAGGFGSALLELFERKGIGDVAVKRLGVGDTFVQHATQQELRALYGIDGEGIMAAAREMLKPIQHVHIYTNDERMPSIRVKIPEAIKTKISGYPHEMDARSNER